MTRPDGIDPRGESRITMGNFLKRSRFLGSETSSRHGVSVRWEAKDRLGAPRHQSKDARRIHREPKYIHSLCKMSANCYQAPRLSICLGEVFYREIGIQPWNRLVTSRRGSFSVSSSNNGVVEVEVERFGWWSPDSWRGRIWQGFGIKKLVPRKPYKVFFSFLTL